jgi:hypothetical protein
MSDALKKLTRQCGSSSAVALYLDRCQVETPVRVISKLWELLAARRKRVGKTVDFGAGDGRFAKFGNYKQYLGYEIDLNRWPIDGLPKRAKLIGECAFAAEVRDADACVGNPPYVRNQDFPLQWRKRAAAVIRSRTEVSISGLANAWQYFTFLALASTKADGIVALVIPYEWVSRPSSRALRDFIEQYKWEVSIYRLRDETFASVYTTSSIAIIDKSRLSRRWNYYSENLNGTFTHLRSENGSNAGAIRYSKRDRDLHKIFARRGLSPGNQSALVLTEEQRLKHKLRIGRDVVRCITSLRPLPEGRMTLTPSAFKKYYVEKGAKCWLLRTRGKASNRLLKYLRTVPSEERNTATCRARNEWWRFSMPGVPSICIATCFRGAMPKSVINAAQVVAVGVVSGVYGLSSTRARKLVSELSGLDISARIIPHANGLRKLEVGQLSTILQASLLKKVS